MYQLGKLQSLDGLIHGISTKAEGNMSFKWGEREEVIKNRKQFLAKLGITPEHCVAMTVQHGTEIKSVDSSLAGRGMFGHDGIEVDALITKEMGLFLFLLTADCLPIIFYDPLKKVIALCHVGWKSADGKIAEKVVATLSKVYTGKPADLVVGIGPGIHKESYKFPDPLEKQLHGWESFLIDLLGGETAIDIVGYTKKQLLDTGVLENNIEISPIDTANSLEFFSHYRSKRTDEREGRFATVVGMRT